MELMATPGAPIVKVYYGRPMLPDVSRVLACLYEKDVEFKLVDMYEGKHMPADLLKLQASTRVPVPGIEDGSTFLSESRAICRYVSGKYVDRGNKYLLGRDMLERASIEQWLKSEEQSFDPPSWALVFHLAFAMHTRLIEPDRALIDQSEQRLAKVLDVYEQRLSESRYLAGNEFTLADLSHLPNSHYLAESSEWAYLFQKRKNVQRWWELISHRPSWTKVVDKLNEVWVPKVLINAEDSPASQQSSSQVMRSMSPATKPQIIHQPIPTALNASVQMSPPSGPSSQHDGPPSVSPQDSIAKSDKQSSSTAQPTQNLTSAQSSLQEPLDKATQTSSKAQLGDQVTPTTPREPPAPTPTSTQQDATEKKLNSKSAETAPNTPTTQPVTQVAPAIEPTSERASGTKTDPASSQTTEKTPSTDFTKQTPQKPSSQTRELSSNTQSTPRITTATTRIDKKANSSEQRAASSSNEQSVAGAQSTEVASLNANPSTQPVSTSQSSKEKGTQKDREATVQHLEAASLTAKPITETSTASNENLIQSAQAPVQSIKPGSRAQSDTGTTTQPAQKASIQSTEPEYLNAKQQIDKKSALQASEKPLPAQVQKDASQQIQPENSTSEQTTGTDTATQNPTKEAPRDNAQST
ncbi:uncharacterized protein [Typha angustifolia]|uniref:uncharacterized protein n=1 Tax=Typha angustifolia TaxID=59011 RepID=UPI003C2ED9EE